MELMQASRQWASRPDDERFVSLTDLDAHCQASRNHSAARVVSSRSISCAPLDGDAAALMVVGPGGSSIAPTHWAFGQICARVGAPTSYLRDLPAPMAADCINYGLQRREIEEVGVLLHRNGGAPELRAVTGPN